MSFLDIFVKFNRAPSQVVRMRWPAVGEGNQIVLAMFRTHYTHMNLYDIMRESTINRVGSQIHPRRFFEEVDKSPTYLLFQTLLPLFWTLTCMT